MISEAVSVDLSAHSYSLHDLPKLPKGIIEGHHQYFTLLPCSRPSGLVSTDSP
jgi:hypothetical protein